jgi:hypothetical protein
MVPSSQKARMVQRHDATKITFGGVIDMIELTLTLQLQLV